MPACKTLILARPTKSLALYMQMAGRIFRPWNDVRPIVLDHGGNVDRHGLPHEDRDWSLDAKPKKLSATLKVKACPSCFAFIASAYRSCPHCGHEYPASSDATDRALIEPVPVDLALRTLEGDDAKIHAFRALHKQCRSRGWKLGAAIHRYRERFGEDPPARWILALKSDYRGDVEWKGRIKARQAERGDSAA